VYLAFVNYTTLDTDDFRCSAAADWMDNGNEWRASVRLVDRRHFRVLRRTMIRAFPARVR